MEKCTFLGVRVAIAKSMCTQTDVEIHAHDHFAGQINRWRKVEYPRGKVFFHGLSKNVIITFLNSTLDFFELKSEILRLRRHRDISLDEKRKRMAIWATPGSVG